MSLNARSSCPILLGSCGRQPRQRGGARGQALAGGVEGLQELLFPGQGEAADAGLQVDHQPLEFVGGGEHLLGVPGGPGGSAQVGDGEQQDGEGGPKDQQEQPARQQHPPGQPAPQERRRRRGRGLRPLDHAHRRRLTQGVRHAQTRRYRPGGNRYADGIGEGSWAAVPKATTSSWWGARARVVGSPR
jgi:hypothetical protein